MFTLLFTSFVFTIFQYFYLFCFGLWLVVGGWGYVFGHSLRKKSHLKTDNYQVFGIGYDNDRVHLLSKGPGIVRIDNSQFNNNGNQYQQTGIGVRNRNNNDLDRNYSIVIKL